MATNQPLYGDIFEGILYPHLKASETMAVGDVVMLDATSGYPYVKKCVSSGIPFGYSAQEVTTAGLKDYEPGGFTLHTAKVGDFIGVYIGSGVYNTKDATAATWGAEVYAGTSTAGKLSTTASTANVKVGICVKAKDSAGISKVKSYL